MVLMVIQANHIGQKIKIRKDNKMEYYEKLANECSYLQIDYERLEKMKKTLNIMKLKLQQLTRIQ